MKRLFTFLVMLVLFVTSLVAQVIRFKAYDFSIREHTSRGWTNYSDPSPCNILISFDMDADLVTIYSKQVQVFEILDNSGWYIDSDGDSVSQLGFIDNDRVRGRMRLMVRKRSGDAEIYVDYGNVGWVYRVLRID